ncbi:hypothetical protein GCM10011492_00930 [Flexivirga endophytica]|uniref:O-antigen ligase-related domain-containing protein n=1 Tax=Flexivirga endophytica TaxID=1849103 RepID=A0A916WNP3_9MICO|nr:O-antigen ligase family protein [Flexivirga endophytica]GGB15077.1 hypothetical protein GCM10011492_00930 [Flexivirga endophytica]GHB65182.1 hypothetical protein GCM10008112_37560 [Flexivirga endophytica]
MWLFAFAILVLMPMVSRLNWDPRPIILRTWLVLGTLTSFYALIERLLGRNVLFSTIYSAAADPAGTAVQHWSDYRAQASFGHPIYAGMFFAATAVLAYLSFFESNRDRRFLILGLLSSAALICTGTRGAIIGLVAGVAIGLLPKLKRQSGTRIALSLLGLVGTFIAVVSTGGGEKIWQGVTGRFTSQEAAVSAGGRQSVIDLSLKIAEEHSWMGAGVGTSRSVFRHAGSTIPVESGPLQVLVSEGIPGLLLMTLGLLTVGYALWRSGHGIELGLLVTSVICLSGFNGFEDVPTTMTWLGLALLAARSAASGGGGLTPRSTPASPTDVAAQAMKVVGAHGH